MMKLRRLNQIALALLVCCCIGLCVGLALTGCSVNKGAVSERPTVMVFTSPRCGACVSDYEVVERISNMGLVTVKIYVAEQSPEELAQWKVYLLPTYVLFADGREHYRTHQAEKMRRWIKRNL